MEPRNDTSRNNKMTPTNAHVKKELKELWATAVVVMKSLSSRYTFSICSITYDCCMDFSLRFLFWEVKNHDKESAWENRFYGTHGRAMIGGLLAPVESTIDWQ